MDDITICRYNNDNKYLSAENFRVFGAYSTIVRPLLLIKPVLSDTALPKTQTERTKKQVRQSSEPTLRLPTLSALTVATFRSLEVGGQ